MTKNSNQNVVCDFFARFCSADVSGALELLDESVEWRAMGREGGLPMSGTMDKHSIGELITNVKALFPEGLKLTPSGWTCEADRVAVEMESHGVKANGTIYNNFYHFLLIVDRGRISHVREYFDTLHVKQVFIDDK